MRDSEVRHETNHSTVRFAVFLFPYLADTIPHDFAPNRSSTTRSAHRQPTASIDENVETADMAPRQPPSPKRHDDNDRLNDEDSILGGGSHSSAQQHLPYRRHPQPNNERGTSRWIRDERRGRVQPNPTRRGGLWPKPARRGRRGAAQT